MTLRLTRNQTIPRTHTSVRAEPFDFAQDRLVEAPALGFDKLSPNGFFASAGRRYGPGMLSASQPAEGACGAASAAASSASFPYCVLKLPASSPCCCSQRTITAS